MLRRLLKSFGLLIIALLASNVWAMTINYSFITGANSYTGSGPVFNSSDFVSGTFIYDPLTPDSGMSSNGSTRYPGSVIDLSGMVGGYSFSDPSSRIIVGNDLPPLPSYPPSDLLLIDANPSLGSELSGFTIGEFTLIDVRLFWIEYILYAPDFLNDQTLPALLPAFEGRLSLDFLRSDGSPLSYNDSVAFNGLFVATSPIPEPTTMLLLGSGLFGFAVIGRKRFKK